MQREHARWYRQPILWLGALIFVALLAGCVSLIVMASQYADDTPSPGGNHVLKVPIARMEQVAPPAASESAQ